MASNDPGRTLRHDEETTAPPEGMYWVQMQGLWALRPIADLDYTDEKPNSSQRTERSARSTLEQQRAPLTDADRQWLAQSAGASCSTAAASVDASAPTVGEGSSRPERLPRTQGVIEFHQQHCSPSFAAAVAHDGPPRVQPQPFTPPPPGPAPAAALLGGAQIGGQLGAQPSEGSPEQQSQEWPDWLLQWGWRVESGGGGPSDAPDSSAPPSAPPSPPETPQRSKSQTALARSPCGHPQQAVRPPTASEARPRLLRAARLWVRAERRALAAWMPKRCSGSGALCQLPVQQTPLISLCLRPPRQRRLRRQLFYPLSQWGAQLPRPWAQLALTVPILATMVLLARWGGALPV